MKSKILILAVLLIGFTTVFTSCEKDEVEPTPTPNYTNFKITSVKITAMPFLNDNSTSWDLMGGPDVLFNMEDVNSNVLMNGSSARLTDVSTSDLPLNWNFTTAYEITNLAVTHYVTVYDYDTPDADDLIGYVGFKIEDYKSGYPTTISNSKDGVSVTIIGSWY
jgi:hypothetical protein